MLNNVLFFGTPDFAAAIMEKLVNNSYGVTAAVSQPDKPKGRGHKLMPTAVKQKAQELGIPVLQPESLKEENFAHILYEIDPDVIVVAAYGKLLPKYIIDYPTYGCINVHASLLPKYRGAAPVQRSIINGDKTTGVTIMHMDDGLDTGDILSMAEVEIGEYESSGELLERLGPIGGDLLVATLSSVVLGNAKYKKQDDEKASYAGKLDRSMANIDWSKSAAEISKFICGMNPAPIAQTTYKGSVVKIYEAEKTEAEGSPGEILGIVKNKGVLVACGSGGLYLSSVQFAGSKRMSSEAYARGHEIEVGAVLG